MCANTCTACGSASTKHDTQISGPVLAQGSLLLLIRLSMDKAPGAAGWEVRGDGGGIQAKVGPASSRAGSPAHPPIL